ncbi:unnamed protein product, partial [Dovyalis caffra]
MHGIILVVTILILKRNSPVQALRLGDMEAKSTIGSIDFKSKDGGTLRTTSFKKRDLGRSTVDESDCGFNKIMKPAKINLQTIKNLVMNGRNLDVVNKVLDHRAISSSDHSEGFAAETKLQKSYRSYRTRRNLADCAVVVEELWSKALDFAALRRSSISFFDSHRPETAVSRWARARTSAAKVGKGLSKSEKAQKLALGHWLEAIDPRHRYGHNLQLYYSVWFASESRQPFLYWLDVGDGKEKEREEYEVIVEAGKLIFKKSRLPVHTIDGNKWIFVLGTSRKLYVGKKQKGLFQHSSFLSGGAAIAAGRLVARGGVPEAIWAYSGHYRPSEENFLEFIVFLEEQHVDLTNVKKCPIDDDIPPPKVTSEKEVHTEKKDSISIENISSQRVNVEVGANGRHIRAIFKPNEENREASIFEFGKLCARKRTSEKTQQISYDSRHLNRLTYHQKSCQEALQAAVQSLHRDQLRESICPPDVGLASPR